MALSVPATILAKWPILTRYGATKSCVYRKMAAPVYSTTTKLVTRTITSSTNLEVLFDEVKKAQLPNARTQDEPVLVKDKAAFFPALSLAFVPLEDDVIVDNASVLWTVLSVAVDPTGALFTLMLRQQP
jgi:hypothetical protein